MSAQPRPAAELSLRLMDASDRDLWVSLYTDPETMRWISEPLSVERANRSFEVALRMNLEAVVRRRFFVATGPGSGAEVGLAGYSVETAEVASIGVMVHPCSRGRGVGRAVLALALHRAMSDTRVDRISVDCAHENVAAVRMVESLGFRLDHASPRQDGSSRGIFSILRTNWQQSAVVNEESRKCLEW